MGGIWTLPFQLARPHLRTFVVVFHNQSLKVLHLLPLSEFPHREDLPRCDGSCTQHEWLGITHLPERGLKQWEDLRTGGLLKCRTGRAFGIKRRSQLAVPLLCRLYGYSSIWAVVVYCLLCLLKNHFLGSGQLCHPCKEVWTTEVHDRGWSCYTSRTYCFLSWVHSGLKVLAPKESGVPSARNTPFHVCKKQQMLPLRAVKVGSVFAFPGSWWEEVCKTCGIWVSCPCGGVWSHEAFEMLTVLLPGTRFLLFSLSWPHLFSFP